MAASLRVLVLVLQHVHELEGLAERGVVFVQGRAFVLELRRVVQEQRREQLTHDAGDRVAIPPELLDASEAKPTIGVGARDELRHSEGRSARVSQDGRSRRLLDRRERLEHGRRAVEELEVAGVVRRRALLPLPRQRSTHFGVRSQEQLVPLEKGSPSLVSRPKSIFERVRNAEEKIREAGRSARRFREQRYGHCKRAARPGEQFVDGRHGRLQPRT